MAIDPETGLEIGVDPETGLPMTVGTGNIVDPNEAGSDVMSEAGSAGDPDYDPNFIDMFDGIEDAPNIDQIGEEDDIEMPEMAMGPQSQETAISASSSFRGITDAGKKQAGGFFGDARARADQKGGALADQFAQDSARVNANIDKRKQLAQELAGYDQEHQDELLDIRRAQRDHHLKQAKLEEMAWNKSMQGATQYIAQYKQEMAGVRQMMLQTGNPLGGLTAVEGGALGAALFAQGFLGARGIQVNVSGQVDRWVEREMAAHQQKIQNATNAAESNLTLYNLARQGAMDDVMARQRMRGFVLDALKSSIYMEAARYKSQSALADAQMKAAELDALALQNEMAMRDKLVKNQMDIYDKEILAAKYAADASTQAWSTSIDAKYKDRMAAVAEREKPATEKQGPSQDYYNVPDFGKPIRDKEGKVVGYQIGWTIDPNLSDSEGKAIREKLSGPNAAYLGVMQGVERLKQLKTKYGKEAIGSTGIEAIDSKMSSANREYIREATGVVRDIRHAIAGANLTENERKEWLETYGTNKLLQAGDNSVAPEQLEEQVRRSFATIAAAIPGVTVNEDETRSKKAEDRLNTTNATRDAAMAPEKQQTKAGKAYGDAKSVDRFTPTGESGTTLYRLYRSAGGDRAGLPEAKPGFEDVTGSAYSLTAGTPDQQVLQDQQVDRLVKIAVRPEQYAKTNSAQDIEDIREEALTKVAELGYSGNRYAKFAYDLITSSRDAKNLVEE